MNQPGIGIVDEYLNGDRRPVRRQPIAQYLADPDAVIDDRRSLLQGAQVLRQQGE
jgi:hypothetical protein